MNKAACASLMALLILGIVQVYVSDAMSPATSVPKETPGRCEIDENLSATLLPQTNGTLVEEPEALGIPDPSVAEGPRPLYVLVFGDEEEREIMRRAPGDPPYPIRNWTEWAILQIERGDDLLVSKYGIDIRILAFLPWDTDDSSTTMYDIWDELQNETDPFLEQPCSGEWWTEKVDAVIGITAQPTPNDWPGPIGGLAPNPEYLRKDNTFILLKWHAYYVDDNLVTHEVSHLFAYDGDPTDHDPPCCMMANHTHYIGFYWEDALWAVFDEVTCALLANSWCPICDGGLLNNEDLYCPKRVLKVIDSPYGVLGVPFLGKKLYGPTITPITETIRAYPNAGYKFFYWLVNHQMKYKGPYFDPYPSNPIDLTVDEAYVLEAKYAEESMFDHGIGGGGGGC